MGKRPSTHARARRGLARLTGVALALLLTPACAIEDTSGRVVSGVLRELNQPDTREELAELGELMPGLEDAAREMAQGFIEGGIEALSDEERTAKIEEATDRFVGAVTRALEEAGAVVPERLRQELTKTVDALLDEALSAEHRRDAALIVDAVTDAALRSVARELKGELGESLDDALSRRVGPGLERVLKDDVAPGTREVVRQALLGVNDALVDERGEPTGLGLTIQRAHDQLLRSLDQQTDKLSTSATGVLAGGQQAADSVAWAAGLIALALALALGLVVAMWRWAVYSARRREETLELLTRAIGEAERGGSVEDVLGNIKRLGREGPQRGYAFLEEFLARHPGARVRKPSEPDA
ncbi:MAG: hypothetical protein H6713_03890 [Myxococcales bacterium]|nr:hypothetical protein [Myxococcales bacterium]MCB9749131.1 hypothetical protein [Myxococcales bacterium]